ncbi:MAG: prenyltransferase/squalene oxidase repeat-containing protein, partial [Planctomycetota bacterium JB042]
MRGRAAASALVAFVGLASCGGEAGGDRELRRAAEWLWSRQRDDGSWRSDRYAVLRSGQALTPFVLLALLRVPGDVAPPPDGGVERALSFLRRSVDEDGALGYADPDVLEYPVYATAAALRCLVLAGEAGDRPAIDAMAGWLAARQRTETNGFPVSAVAHGGFPFGERGLAPGDPGHVDLSHTRRALEALAAAGRLDDGARAAARRFLARHAHPNGGFRSSLVVPAANKGTVDEDGRPGAYATAACDGLLALLAAGASSEEDEFGAARDWLARRRHLTWPEGIPGGSPWGDALFFFHLAVRAEAFAALGGDAASGERIVELLRARQDADGSFTNRDSPLQKEDEPLLATAHAVTALACVRAGATVPRP